MFYTKIKITEHYKNVLIRKPSKSIYEIYICTFAKKIFPRLTLLLK